MTGCPHEAVFCEGCANALITRHDNDYRRFQLQTQAILKAWQDVYANVPWDGINSKAHAAATTLGDALRRALPVDAEIPTPGTPDTTHPTVGDYVLLPLGADLFRCKVLCASYAAPRSGTLVVDLEPPSGHGISSPLVVHVNALLPDRPPTTR
jgi:hypothetical protein